MAEKLLMKFKFKAHLWISSSFGSKGKRVFRLLEYVTLGIFHIFALSDITFWSRFAQIVGWKLTCFQISGKLRKKRKVKWSPYNADVRNLYTRLEYPVTAEATRVPATERTCRVAWTWWCIAKPKVYTLSVSVHAQETRPVQTFPSDYICDRAFLQYLQHNTMHTNLVFVHLQRIKEKLLNEFKCYKLSHLL